ncbi:MAG: hypothetical protein HY926_14435 [Elusimicrobia bacterium]|nr:hypothetical protein [Elusimicrobiota bacterium]
MLRTGFLLLFWTAQAHAAPALVKEPGVRLSSAVVGGAVNAPPDANNPMKIVNAGTRFYYIRGSTAVYSALTNDGGQTFVDDAGIRLSSATPPLLHISSITGLSILPLTPVPGGGYRMVYTAVSTSAAGDVYDVCSATSADGLAWANDTGTRISGGGNFLGSPSLVKLGTGEWRLYYIQNTGAATLANRRIHSALSSDQGRNFPTKGQLAFSAGQAGDVAATKLTNGRIRLYYTAPLSGETTNSTLVSALSQAGDAGGTLFDAEAGVRLATDSASGFLSAPFVIRSTDSWRWKLYYNYAPFATAVSTAEVFSASAYAPAPSAMSPSTVLRTAGSTAFTVTGDGFSQTAVPVLTLNQGGTVIASDAAATRTDDQTLSVNFTLTGRALGSWDLKAVNDNGYSGTLSGALYLDFAPGTVRMTDNLMRPSLGTQARIDVMTFSAGPLSVKLYTLDGGLVKTLYDGPAPEGTTTLFWDGKTGGGRTVASGVYLLRAVGMKLMTSEKIVVIK